MVANTTDHIYVSVNKLHIHLHLLSDLDGCSYELAQYPVWTLLINIWVCTRHKDMIWMKKKRKLKTLVV